jgi:D-alanyl-D-alanine carboxypeptidase
LNTYAQTNPTIDLQNVVDTFIVNHKIPAMAVAVIKLDTVLTVVSGFNKKTGGSPVQLSSKFHLGSNSKAITSFIAAKLVEQGKLKWDTKLLDVLPELKATTAAKFQDITLEQLLSHTAGIKAYTGGIEFAQLPNFQGTLQNQRFLLTKHTLAHDTLLTVGNYAYSNAGFTIVAVMLERIAQKTWEEQLKQTFQECGIGDFYIGFPNRETANNPWGHWVAKGDTLEAASPSVDYDISIVAPAGDISMNIVDYSKFIQLHVQGLSGSNNYLKSETYEKMHFGKEKYAFGWGNGKGPNGFVSTHNGSAGNFYAHTMIFKEKKIAVIVIANASSPSIDAAVINMRRSLFNMYNK